MREYYKNFQILILKIKKLKNVYYEYIILFQ